jgi:hypothetical protein
MDSESIKTSEPPQQGAEIAPKRYEVTVNLVTSVSTTANVSFDKAVSVFAKRISDKAAEVFGKSGTQEITTIPKST